MNVSYCNSSPQGACACQTAPIGTYERMSSDPFYGWRCGGACASLPSGATAIGALRIGAADAQGPSINVISLRSGGAPGTGQPAQVVRASMKERPDGCEATPAT
jgi:hypothetical protein